jgi:hypothetical protein
MDGTKNHCGKQTMPDSESQILHIFSHMGNLKIFQKTTQKCP